MILSRTYKYENVVVAYVTNNSYVQGYILQPLTDIDGYIPIAVAVCDAGHAAIKWTPTIIIATKQIVLNYINTGSQKTTMVSVTVFYKKS